uniref:BFN domain-containing protein n=1 Tax=Mesocestoides corti TaxID=53468 RepID=A0A5K3EVS0_MESCO
SIGKIPFSERSVFCVFSAVESNGRISISTQTGLYLEEITDIVETDNFGVQTDQFVDRPTSPIMYIAKIGIDVATQIEPWELFDFEIEVRPLMEVLLNKTMEQALMEVIEEEELAEIRKKQLAFEELRNADLAEVERLEERNRRFRSGCFIVI